MVGSQDFKVVRCPTTTIDLHHQCGQTERGPIGIKMTGPNREISRDHGVREGERLEIIEINHPPRRLETTNGQLGRA